MPQNHYLSIIPFVRKSGVKKTYGNFNFIIKYYEILISYQEKIIEALMF
jgi:hypothetical protein